MEFIENIKASNIYTYVFEPMLLTSLLLIPISYIYLKQQYYVLSFLIFFNGIFSYIYHLNQNNDNHYYECCKKKDTDEKEYEDEDKDMQQQIKDELKEKKNDFDLVLDRTTSILSFLFSLKATLEVDSVSQIMIAVLSLFALSFYYLNCQYKNYYYHLLWHVFVLLGQLILSLSVRTEPPINNGFTEKDSL